jgi:hypothetical protein
MNREIRNSIFNLPEGTGSSSRSWMQLSWGGVIYIVTSLDGTFIRIGLRNGYVVKDTTITALGFDGTENTDWVNIRSTNAFN